MTRWITAALCTALIALGAHTAAAQDRLETAIFAGGCFWCVEEVFDEVPGVQETISGYTGGSADNPTYKQVTAGGTGHYEAVEVRYDPSRVTYEQLLDTFWRNIDPFDARGQFCDKGSSYRSAIFYLGQAQNNAAQYSKQRVQKRFNKPVATAVEKAGKFWPAEEYHQDYHNKNPARYKFYKWNCGRAQRLEEIWGPKSG